MECAKLGESTKKDMTTPQKQPRPHQYQENGKSGKSNMLRICICVPGKPTANATHPTLKSKPARKYNPGKHLLGKQRREKNKMGKKYNREI